MRQGREDGRRGRGGRGHTHAGGGSGGSGGSGGGRAAAWVVFDRSLFGATRDTDLSVQLWELVGRWKSFLQLLLRKWKELVAEVTGYVEEHLNTFSVAKYLH